MTRPLGAFLFLLVFAVGLLSYAGTFHNPADEWLTMSMTESLVKHHALDVDQMYWVGEHLGFARYNPDGHLYTRYSIAQAIAGAPLYAIGLANRAAGAAQTASLTGVVVLAITAVLVFQLVVGLGYGRGIGVWLAVLYAFATPAIVYAKTYYAEPLAGMLLVGGTYLLLRSGPSRRPVLLAAAGLLFGVLGLTKPPNLLLALPALVYVGWPLGTWLGFGEPRRRRESYGPLPNPLPEGEGIASPLPLGGCPSGRGRRPGEGSMVGRLGLIFALLAFLLPFALGVAALLWANALRFGSPLDFGYAAARDAFGTNPLLGIYGLLLSPGRGLLIYVPFLVAAPFGLRDIEHRFRGAGWLLGGIAGLAVIVYAQWNAWHGGSAQWGPRFVVPVLPLLAVLVAPVAQRWWALRRPLPLAAGVLAVALSLTFQASATFFNYMAYVHDLSVARGITPDREDNQLTSAFLDPAASPILRQFVYLTAENADVSWIVTEGGRTSTQWGPATASLALIVLSAIGVSTALRRPWSFALDAGAGGLLILAVVTAAATLANASRHPYWGDAPTREAISIVSNLARPGDAIISEGAPITAAGLNFDRSVARRVGLPVTDGPLDRPVTRKLDEIGQSSQKIWLLQMPARAQDALVERLEQAGWVATEHAGNGWRVLEFDMP